jgi:hypothetical protein
MQHDHRAGRRNLPGRVHCITTLLGVCVAIQSMSAFRLLSMFISTVFSSIRWGPERSVTSLRSGWYWLKYKRCLSSPGAPGYLQLPYLCRLQVSSRTCCGAAWSVHGQSKEEDV